MFSGSRWTSILALVSIGVAVAILGQIELCAGQPDRIYWVQIAEPTDHAAAESLLLEMSEAGYSPCCIYPAADGPTVRVGEFSKYMDAFLLWEDIHESYTGARIRYNSITEEREAGRTWQFRPLTAPQGSHTLFNLTTSPLDTSVLSGFDPMSAPILEGGMLPPGRAPSDAAGIEAMSLDLFSAASAVPGDPAGGMALLVMGDIRASQGELRRARDVLLPVASGAVAASSEARYQAMWLMARVYHALDWRRTAYRAYREIETVCPTLRDLTLCQLEQIGLLMELARSGSGRLVECRLASDIFIEEHSSLASEDSQVRQRCATAALMAAESWFWEGQCERCIEETSRVAVLYEDITREWAVAMTFKGFALARLGRHLEAITVFHEVCDHPWNSETDDFPNYHQQAIAASALVRSLEATGQSEAAVNWRNTILERWPDSRTARQLMTNALEGVR